MKYFSYIINCALIISIPMLIITGIKTDTQTANTTIDVKKVKSNKLYTKQEELKIEPVEYLEEEPALEKEGKIEEIKEENKIIKMEETLEEQESNILNTLTGKMSGYGPDCAGCKGYTSSGYNITNTIYYYDTTFGNVRILAADRTLAIGSIVRVKDSKLEEFIGIVLDRGGNVGIGKTYLFDLLFSSEQEAYRYGSSSNVTFEVLRNGY